MTYSSPAQIIHEVKRIVESSKRSELRLNANGGNSIILLCEPIREIEYITNLDYLLEISDKLTPSFHCKLTPLS